MDGFAKLPTFRSLSMSALVTELPPAFAGAAGIGERQSDLAVFQQPWWLEIARRGEDYHELQVRHGGVVVGTLGFVLATNHIGNRLGFPPIWAHLGGPILEPGLGRSARADVLHRLMAQLPRNISFKFVCNPIAPDADLTRQAFRGVGFEHHAETTYVQRCNDRDIMSRLSAKRRGQLRRADRDLEVLEIDAEKFIRFYRCNLREAGKTSYASLANARDLIVKGQEGVPQVRVLAARQKGEDTPLDAAIACAWDDTRYYLWLLTRRHNVDANGRRPHGDAVKLLIFRATQHAQSLNLTFDVDGATTEGAKNLYDDILRFPLVESRDVFIRDTRIYRLYKQLKPRLREQSIKLRNSRGIKSWRSKAPGSPEQAIQHFWTREESSGDPAAVAGLRGTGTDHSAKP